MHFILCIVTWLRIKEAFAEKEGLHLPKKAPPNHREHLRKKVRLMVELDPIRYELNAYDEPLVEMRDSL